MALAIALGQESPHPNDPPEGPDSFLADHGFEYIDGERTRRSEMVSASEENDEDDDDVQGLSRVVDALSTIMWPTMVRERDSGSKRKSELRPSLFDFDDAVLLAEAGGEDDEEETLAALMEADAAEQGAPQTRASRMRKEMAALERWLVENEELHEAEFGGAGVDVADGGDEDGDEDEDDDHVGVSDSGDRAPLPSVQPSASAAAASDTHTPTDDPWAASATSNPTSARTPSTAPASHASISITTPISGFDDDFSAFVSAPPSAVSIAGDSAAAAATGKTTTTTSTATTATASASASEPIADARRLYTQTQLLRPSHTGGSIRSIRSAVSEMSISDIGDDSGGYEALDDRSTSSLNFSPEHDDDDDDADPRTSIGGQRSGDRAASLGDVPFDLPNILNALQTIREDVAGIENEAERRATTARFASEFVFKRMGVDGDEREEVEG